MHLFKKIIFAGVFIVTLSACKANINALPDYSNTSTQELERLHKKGDVHATYTLGFNHFFNNDSSLKENVSNVEQGLSYLQEAHDKGHMEAHSNLSLIFDRGLFEVPVNSERASAYSLDGAKRGSDIGKINYGLSLIHI